MCLGIMQPYFFPYLGYFNLIVKTDLWIVFDVVNYKSKSWMNRNRILSLNKDSQYITVSIKKATGPLIKTVSLVSLNNSRKDIIGKLQVYKGKAPYYDTVINLVEEVFQMPENVLLRDLNVRALELVCNYLDINFNYKICSQMDLDFTGVKHAGQWALEICSQLGAKTYVNLPGGREIFRLSEWEERGIKLRFTKIPDFIYKTCRQLPFQPNLSIIDVIMWNEPSTIRYFLENQNLDD